MASQERMNVPIWIIIGLQQRERQYSPKLNKDTVCRLPVTSAQFIIGTEKYPNAGIKLNYNDDDDSQCYAQFKEVFRALTKDDILQAYIRDTDFRSSNVKFDDIGCSFYVFYMRYQRSFTAHQPFKIEFKFDGVVSTSVSVSSDGQRYFDLI